MTFRICLTHDEHMLLYGAFYDYVQRDCQHTTAFPMLVTSLTKLVAHESHQPCAFERDISWSERLHVHVSPPKTCCCLTRSLNQSTWPKQGRPTGELATRTRYGSADLEITSQTWLAANTSFHALQYLAWTRSNHFPSP